MRKTVTVMFMDAVGSTDIGERTDPESLRRVMTRYFGEIRTIVERHGGTVEKYIGDAVMAVFGVPVVHEDDALRAVRAAAEIRDRVATLEAEFERDRGITISWRTGINTGEVVAGDAGAGQRFVSGDAVNVAARLEQSAQAAEVLLGGETYLLVRESVTVEQAEPVVAKGKSGPVAAYRLIGLSATGATPAACVADRRPDSPMIGRLRQRRLLSEAFEQAVDERICHLFTILGAAGVGKSRLVSEFLGSLGGNALVLHGRCLSYGEGITYWPIAEALREAAGLTEADDDDLVRAKIGELIPDERDRGQAVQRLGEVLGRFEGSGLQEEAFWAVRTLVESLAQRKPVVLVIDDVHWAEPTLLDLVEHLADWTRDSPLLLVCLARQELLESRQGWGGGKRYATTITLEPLSDRESRELVGSLVGQVSLGAQLEEKIAAAAEGNPLFVEEMVGMLIDAGQLVRRNGGWAAIADLADVSVPPSIQALIAARLDGLPSAERAVLERGSVEGKVFHRSAVAELAPDVLRDSVPGHLRALARKELVRPERGEFVGDEAFRFRHLLIRDAAYGALSKETRSELHARYGGWLTRAAGDHISEYEEILGYHYEQAFRYRTELGPVDDEARHLAALAGRHLGASGVRALDRGDIHAARKLLSSAIQLVPATSSAGIRLRAELGLALSMAGEVRAADALLAATIDAAEGAGDVVGRALAEVGRIDAMSSLGEMPIEDVIARSEELLRVFDQHGEQRGAERAAFELARHHFFAGRAKIAEQILVERIAGYPPSEAPPMMLRWLPTMTAWGPTPVAEAARRIADITASSGSRVVTGQAFAPLGMLRAWAGDFDEGRRLIQLAIALCDEVGMRRYALSIAGNYLGALELLAGNYEAAETVLLAAYQQLSALGDRGFSSSIAGQLAHLYTHLGRFDEADRYALVARETATPDDVEAQARGLSASARVLAHRGELGAAEALAARAVEMVDRTDYLDLRAQTYAEQAEVLVEAGKRAAALDALQSALEMYEAKGATFIANSVRKRLEELSLSPAN
ncbi:MAG: ATP-binding protein [Candidatus Limnocylindrales bacterium]